MFPRSTDDLRRPLVLLAVALTLACDASPKEKASTKDATAVPGESAREPERAKPRGDDPPSDTASATPDAPPTKETPPASFEDTIAAIPADAPDASDRAFAAFVKRHGKAKHGEDAMRRDLDILLELVSDQALRLDEQLQKDGPLAAAGCRFTRQCDSGEPTPAAEARLKRFRERGVTVVYAGEGTIEATIDYAVVASRLGSVLSRTARAYLEACDADQQAMSQHDEGGYDGDPRELGDAALSWEKVAVSGVEAYAEDARLRVVDVFTAYLRVPWRPYDRHSPVTKKPRAEYRRFVDEHATSAFAPAVQHYLDAMKRLKHRPTEAQLDATIAEALKRAKPLK